MSDDDNGRPRLRLVGSPPPGDHVSAPDGPTPASPPAPVGPVLAYPAGAWSTVHDLTGSVILLTGHGDGLDDAIATGLADHGARLAIAQRDIERAKLTAQISSRPGSQGSIALGMDSTQPEQVRRGIGAVEQLTSQLDALVVIVDLGRATAGREARGGVSLGEMIHLVRAAERRMAVIGGGRILIVAGGAPRDPAVGAITTGAVVEFVRTVAPGFAAQGVTINGIIAALPVVAVAPVAAADPAVPAALPARTEPVAEDTVVESHPVASEAPAMPDRDQTDRPVTDDDAAEPAATGVPSDEVIDQAPVIPFPTPSEPPTPLPAPRPASDEQAPAGHPDPAAPAVAAAILFLTPATATLTGQVLRIDATPPAVG